MKLQVQFGRATHAVDLADADSNVTVTAVMTAIESQLGVFVRNQRLIHKGKTLQPKQTLEEHKIGEGAKIMLMTSGGQTLGQLEAEKQAKEREIKHQEALAHAQKREEKLASRQRQQHKKAATDTMQDRAVMWAKTGIITLREAKLSVLPPQVWDTASSAQTLDAAGNLLETLPRQLGVLTRLEKLNVGQNRLNSAGIPEDLFRNLTMLQALNLSYNRLVEMPKLTALENLRVLDLSNNQLAVLSTGSIVPLSNLEHLSVASNALESIPAEIGDCKKLAHLDVSHNKIAQLPPEIGGLQCLRSIQADDNRLTGIPSEILRDCQALQTVSIHRNPVTVEQLRETPEFKEFDARRIAKYSKQLGMRVMGQSSGFDEGADVERVMHWKPS